MKIKKGKFFISPSDLNNFVACKYTALNEIKFHNKEIKIEGIKFFGSAFTPEFNNWAYNHSEKQSKVFWDNAPDSDVVVCHGPPFMVLDSVSSHYPVERPLGCVSFKNYLESQKRFL